MEELADRVGELKAAKSDLDAYLERLKALFVASGRGAIWTPISNG
jgi:hypothetical protein